jgi:transglutaminase-like putative cysteine protease
VGVLGLPGWLQLRLRPARRGIVVLALVLLYTAIWRYMPAQRVQGFIFYPLQHAAAQFFLSLMAMHFFLYSEDELPPTLGFFAAMVAIAAGNFFADEPMGARYGGMCLLLGAVFAVFVSTRPRGQVAEGERGSARRAVATVAVLAGLSALTWLAATAVRENQHELSRLLRRMRLDSHASAATGLSETVDLDAVRRFRQREGLEVAVRVKSPVPPGYLRAAAMERYDPVSGWSRMGGTVRNALPLTNPPRDLPRPSPGRSVFPLTEIDGDGLDADAALVEMDIWPVPRLSGPLLLPYGTEYVQAPTDLLNLGRARVVHAELPGGVSYSAFARRPMTELTRLRDRPEQACLEVPVSLDPAVRDLAGRIFRNCPDVDARLAAVESYFRRNYRYREGISVPGGVDPLSYFLLEQPDAYCEYFASGAVMLLRLGGVPARLVSGFVVTESSRLGSYWLARNNDAHAWVEAWDASRHRWRTLDPTPPAGRPAPDEANFLEALRDRIELRLQELRVAIFRAGLRGLLGWLWLRVEGLLRLLLVEPLGLAITTIAVWAMLVRLIVLRRRQPAPRVESEEVRRLQRAMRRRERSLKRRGLVREPDETLHEFARRIGEEAHRRGDASLGDLARWYAACAEIRYRPAGRPEAVRRLLG